MSVAERVTSRKRGSQRISRPSETTDIESDLITFPHVPIHTNISQTEDNDLDENNKEMERVLGLKGDKLNVAVLIFLYVLQGIPLGLAGSIPMVLSSRNVSYKEQALFSFVYWPFSVKLLWAPIVDAAYFPKFGRRKTWLVPIQYLIALFMWTLSNHVTDLLGNAGDETFQVDVRTLTVVFFMLNFLAATQDIAVDGWALTMLERRNVGWASTCNSVGQTAGFFLGNVVFLALESADFCNTYLRSEPQPEGLVTLGSFLKFWSYVFLISTTLVAIFKHENSSDEEDNEGIIDTYKLLGKILKKPAIISLIGILLTCKIGFAATDGASGLKLIEAGVPREKLALLAIPMVPIQIILPLIISRFTAGPKPLDVFVKAMPYRLLMGIVFALLVYWTSIVKQSYGEHPFWYYIVLLIGYALHQCTLYAMFVAIMAWNARISDPAIGGTYMTLLNTITNLGGNWPVTCALWFIDYLTWKSCSTGGTCDSPDLTKACTEGKGECHITTDGYYIETAICTVIGFIWILWRKKKLRDLQILEDSAWRCTT